VKSLTSKRIAIGIGITFCVVILIWYGGWAVWTQFQLWDTMKNFEYENTLFIVMALVLVMGLGLTMKHRKGLYPRQDVEHSLIIENPEPNPYDLEPIKKQLKENAEKLADIHTIMKFLQKAKQKESGDKA